MENKKKILNSNVIAANSFLSTCQDILSKNQVIEYVEKASMRINNEMDIVVEPFDVENFIEQYNTIVGVDMHKKDIFLRGTNDIRELINSIRKTLPLEVKKILDETGKELMIEEVQKTLIKTPR